jgi:hypothetical protein
MAGADARVAGVGEPLAEAGIGQQAVEGASEIGLVAGRKQQAGLAVADDLLDGGAARGDHGAAAGLVLEQLGREAGERLLVVRGRRGHADGRLREDPRHVVVVDGAQTLDVDGREPALGQGGVEDEREAVVDVAGEDELERAARAQLTHGPQEHAHAAAAGDAPRVDDARDAVGRGGRLPVEVVDVHAGGNDLDALAHAALHQFRARRLGRDEDELGAGQAFELLGGERLGETGVGGARLALGGAGDLVNQAAAGAGQDGAGAPGRAQVDDVVVFALELAADGAAEHLDLLPQPPDDGDAQHARLHEALVKRHGAGAQRQDIDGIARRQRLEDVDELHPVPVRRRADAERNDEKSRGQVAVRPKILY